MEMTPQEQQRFDIAASKLNTDDQLKLKAVMQMIQKEKDAVKKEDVNEDSVEEITGETLDRIDGLIDQPLLIRFLDAFEEIYFDLVEQGENFEPDELIIYLEQRLNDRADDARMSPQMPDDFQEGTPGPKNSDGTPKSNDEMTDDEREDYYNNLDTVDEGVDFFKRIAFKK
mgnify:FL=1